MMSEPFVDLAQSCAPMIAVETLAGIVSLESGFSPFNIRTDSDLPLKTQPASKSEAVQTATELAAQHQDIQLGLSGLRIEDLEKLNMSVSDAFEPCLNLKATATLLKGYYRFAIRLGDDEAQAHTSMLQSFYGQGDPSLGAVVKYDSQVKHEIDRLKPIMTELVVSAPLHGDDQMHSTAVPGMASDIAAENSIQPEAIKPASPSWDVFNRQWQSSILVFQNKNGAN